MKKVVIIFGGKSGEHEVSVNSAISIEKNINRELFNTTVIGIAHNGSWNFGEKIEDIVQEGKVKENGTLSLPSSEVQAKLFEADIVFPIIHGTNGEDGTIQGLLDIANIPYVGSGVLGSAVCMDKVIQKQLCATAGIPQTNYTFFTKTEWENNKESILDIINDKLSYPLFVKPANTGSSVGISKVETEIELTKGILEALSFDNKIIVETSVNNIEEIEISVIGNEILKASECGSIIPYEGFYDYETKYITNDIKVIIPSEISDETCKKITDLALLAYKTLNCSGMARVGLFFQPKENIIVLNEVNTIPGFNKISMYPKLWQSSGINYSALITKLINLAEEKWMEKQKLRYTYR